MFTLGTTQILKQTNAVADAYVAIRALQRCMDDVQKVHSGKPVSLILSEDGSTILHIQIGQTPENIQEPDDDDPGITTRIDEKSDVPPPSQLHQIRAMYDTIVYFQGVIDRTKEADENPASLILPGPLDRGVYLILETAVDWLKNNQRGSPHHPLNDVCQNIVDAPFGLIGREDGRKANPTEWEEFQTNVRWVREICGRCVKARDIGHPHHKGEIL